jgi:hypothetical protein
MGMKLSPSDCAALYAKADAAGKAAAAARVPVPMVVVQRANPLNDASPVVKRYAPVMGGVCGFAWVIVRPGNSAFANYLKKRGLARPDSYAGGVNLWVGDYGQSMEKKEAYAGAFADVLQDAGLRAYSNSRMD